MDKFTDVENQMLLSLCRKDLHHEFETLSAVTGVEEFEDVINLIDHVNDLIAVIKKLRT